MCVITAGVGIGAAMTAGQALVANIAIGATAISGVATLASTGLQIAGSQAQGEAAEKQAQYEYEMAQYEAELERQAGEMEQIKHGINARREYGRAVVAAAASGVDLSAGSGGARELTQMRTFQAIDQQTIGRNTVVAVARSNARGAEALSRGRNARIAANMGSAGAAFSGVANIAAQGNALFTAGAFGNVGSRSTTRLTGPSGVSSPGNLAPGMSAARGGFRVTTPRRISLSAVN